MGSAARLAAPAALLVPVAACASIAGLTDVPDEQDGAAADVMADQPRESSSDSGDSPIASDSPHPSDASDAPQSSDGGGQEAMTDSGGDGMCSGVCPPPSCAPGGAGMTNCGPNGNESCCTSLSVTGGSFYRTYTNSGDGGTGLADQAMVSGFQLDKYAVTVGRFRQFVAAWNGGNGFLPAAGSGKHVYLNNGKGLADSANPGAYETGWVTSDNVNVAPTDTNLKCDPSFQTWTSSPTNQENLPIDCVTWAEAYAFCIWDGGFLPSETERLYAQAGGSQQRQYPWGSVDPGTASQYAIYGCYYPNMSGSCNDVSSIAPVGSATLGAGVWGQLDLAGDMWDWLLDWFATYQNPCIDCAFLTPISTTDRAERGGYWGGAATKLVGWARTSDMPPSRGSYLGFRCARAP